MLLSDLLEAEVRTEEGKKLGQVHDVRVRRLERRTPDGYSLRLVGLVMGGRGIRERLGIDVARTATPIADRELVEWERVIDVDGEQGVVTVSE
jgi:hypothetical protein